MKYLFIQVTFSFCFFINTSSIFAQHKTIIKDTIVEQIVYEYDTVFMDDIKLNIDTIHVPKSRSILLPVSEPTLIYSFPFKPIANLEGHKVNTFGSFGITYYSAINNSLKPNHNIKAEQGEKIHPAYFINVGFQKKRFVCSINMEIRQFNEILKQTIPKSWKDTLDDGYGIYYRDLDGQLVSQIKNQFRFVQYHLAVGHQFGNAHIRISPQALFGGGFNLAQKNFYLDTTTLHLAEIDNTNKISTFFNAGLSCPIEYRINNSSGLNNTFYLTLTPGWQHSFIGPSIYPLTYRDLFGLSLSITYVFKHNK